MGPGARADAGADEDARAPARPTPPRRPASERQPPARAGGGGHRRGGVIGGAIAAALAAAGHVVVTLDQAGDRPVDLAREDEVRAAADAVLARHGQCDVLVHAAAAFDRADLAGVALPTWRRVQAVNVESALLLAQAFAPGMAARGFGRIIFVVSDTIWSPRPGTCCPT